MNLQQARSILSSMQLMFVVEGNIAREKRKKDINKALAALNVATAAIDKQRPLKPIGEPYIISGSPKCPNCGENVIWKQYIHCCKCGQALDWTKWGDKVERGRTEDL